MKITDKNWKKTHEQLTRPFGDADVYWRVERAFGRKAMVLCYLDARSLQNRLDDVLGAESWTCTYRETSNGKNICALSIKINGEWVAKEDGAGDTQFEAAKGGISGALKRAGVAWGIGRHLYELGDTWVELQEERLRVEDRYKITHKDKETRKYLFAKAPSVEFLQSHLFPDGPRYARVGPKVVDKEEPKKAEPKKAEPKKAEPKKKSPPKKKKVEEHPNKAVADEIASKIDPDLSSKEKAQYRIKQVFLLGGRPKSNVHRTMRAAMAGWGDLDDNIGYAPSRMSPPEPFKANEELWVEASIHILHWFSAGVIDDRVNQYIEWHYRNDGDYDENMAPF